MLLEIEKNQIKKLVIEKMKTVFSQHDFKEGLNRQQKDDDSPVTVIDLYISDLVKERLLSSLEYSLYNFFSEEEQNNYKFPAIILDPIDGTRELAEGIPECVVSLAIAKDERLNGTGWIFNPFTGFEIETKRELVPPRARADGKLLGLVSRTEFSKGMFEDCNNDSFIVLPRGSIANKLGLLAAGAADFVVTREPKSIWDIAAGTMICRDRGIVLYQNGNRVLSFDKIRYESTMVWCSPEVWGHIGHQL